MRSEVMVIVLRNNQSFSGSRARINTRYTATSLCGVFI